MPKPVQIEFIDKLFFDDADPKERISLDELRDAFNQCSQAKELPCNLSSQKLTKLVTHLLEIKNADSIPNIRGRTEVYKETELGDGRRLCTLKLDHGARLFYATHDNLFFPLGVTWTHDINQHPLLDLGVQQRVDKAISETVLELQQATQAVPSVSATASPSVSPKKNLARSRQLSEKQEEILTQSISKSVVMVAPAGAGKSLIAVKKLIAQICAGVPVTYIVPTVSLRERVKKDVQQEIIANQLDENSLAPYAVKTWDEWAAAELPVAEGLIPRADLKPVNFDYFLMWYKQNQKKKNAPKVYDAKLLYNELVHIILNPNQALSEFFISETAYANLEPARSFVEINDRKCVYQFLQQYLQYIGNAEQLTAAGFYHAHKLHFILLKKMMEQEIKPKIITSLIVDELQCFGSSQIMTMFIALGADAVPPCNLFLCGDPNQLCGCNPRLIERTNQLVQTYCRVPSEMIFTGVLEMSFRSSRSVSLFANRLLQLINSFGSDERVSTYGLTCSMNAENGEINACDVAQLKNLFEQYSALGITQCVVIVPDDYQITDNDRRQFGHIVKLRETRGCEYHHVFLLGFEDDALQLLNTKKGQLPSDITAAPSFLRVKKVEQRASSSATVVALQMLYLAGTRACDTCTLVNIQSDALKAVVAEIRSFLEAKKTNAAAVKTEQLHEGMQQPTADKTKAPIPQRQPLELLGDIKIFSETYKPESLHALLWNTEIWGDRGRACQAKLLFASCGDNFKKIFPLVEELLGYEEKERNQWLNMSGRELSNEDKSLIFGTIQANIDKKEPADKKNAASVLPKQKNKSANVNVTPAAKPEIPAPAHQAKKSLPVAVAPVALPPVVSPAKEQHFEIASRASIESITRCVKTILLIKKILSNDQQALSDDRLTELAWKIKINTKMLSNEIDGYYEYYCLNKFAKAECKVVFITFLLAIRLMKIELVGRPPVAEITELDSTLEIFCRKSDDIAMQTLIEIVRRDAAAYSAFIFVAHAWRKTLMFKDKNIFIFELIIFSPDAMAILLEFAKLSDVIQDMIIWAFEQPVFSEGKADLVMLTQFALLFGSKFILDLLCTLETYRPEKRVNFLKCMLFKLPDMFGFFVEKQEDVAVVLDIIRKLLRLVVADGDNGNGETLVNHLAQILPRFTRVADTMITVFHLIVRLGGDESIMSSLMMLANNSNNGKTIQSKIAEAFSTMLSMKKGEGSSEMKEEEKSCGRAYEFTLEAIITDVNDVVLRALILLIRNSEIIKSAVLSIFPLFRNVENKKKLLMMSKEASPDDFFNRLELEFKPKQASLSGNSNTFLATVQPPLAQTATAISPTSNSQFNCK